MAGAAPAYRPDPSKTAGSVQAQCGKCGRADTAPGRTFWKPVVDPDECGSVVCYLEKITPAICGHCRALTWPATASIPGTWIGPRRTGSS